MQYKHTGDITTTHTHNPQREWLDPERFAQVVEERALSCKCGWPCCGARISRRNAELVGDDSQPLVYASGATQTLYNMRTALQFCSLACNRAARLFMMALDTSALGLRPCYARRLRPHPAPDAAAPLPEVLAYSVVQEHEPAAVLDGSSSSDEDDDGDNSGGCAGLVCGCGSATAVEGYDAAKMHALGYGRSPAAMLFGDDSSDDDDDDDDEDDEDDDSSSDEEEEEESMKTTELDARMKGLRLSDCGWVLNSLRGWVGEDTRRHCRREGYRAEAGAATAWTAPCLRSSSGRGGSGDDGDDARERAFIATQRQQSLAAMVTNKLAQMAAGCGGSTYAVLVRIQALVATFRMDAPIRGFTPAQQAILAHVLCVLVTSAPAAHAHDRALVDTLRGACTRFLDEHHVSDAEDLPDMLAVFF